MKSIHTDTYLPIRKNINMPFDIVHLLTVPQWQIPLGYAVYILISLVTVYKKTRYEIYEPVNNHYLYSGWHTLAPSFVAKGCLWKNQNAPFISAKNFIKADKQLGKTNANRSDAGTELTQKCIFENGIPWKWKREGHCAWGRDIDFICWFLGEVSICVGFLMSLIIKERVLCFGPEIHIRLCLCSSFFDRAGSWFMSPLGVLVLDRWKGAWLAARIIFAGLLLPLWFFEI